MPGMISDLLNWLLIPIRELLVKHICNTPSSLELLYHAGHCFFFLRRHNWVGPLVVFTHWTLSSIYDIICIDTYICEYITIIQEQLAMLKSCKRNFIYTLKRYIHKEPKDVV